MHYQITRIPIETKMKYESNLDFKKLLTKYSLRCESAGSFVDSKLISFSSVFFFHNTIDSVASIVNKYDAITINLLLETSRIKNLFKEMKAFDKDMENTTNQYFKKMLDAIKTSTGDYSHVKFKFIIYQDEVYFYSPTYKYPYTKNDLIAGMGNPFDATLSYVKGNGIFKLYIEKDGIKHKLPSYEERTLINKIFRILFMKPE